MPQKSCYFKHTADVAPEEARVLENCILELKSIEKRLSSIHSLSLWGHQALVRSEKGAMEGWTHPAAKVLRP